MLNKKQLVSPPFKIDPSFYNKDNSITKDNYAEQLKNLSMEYDRIQNVSQFFIPGVMNVFSDSAISSEIRDKATIANVVTYTNIVNTTSYMSPVAYIDERKSHEAEITSVYFSLICANEIKGRDTVDKINLFTDSVAAIKKLRPILRTVTSYLNDKPMLDAYLNSLNNDDTVEDILFMTAMEASVSKCPLELYHIKGHTRDLMLIATKFLQANGLGISVNDCIELTTYHTMVDSKVNKYIRCPSTTFNA